MVDGHLQEAALEVAVWEALQRVIDPELGVSLVDLGLIRSVTVADGRTLIELALTTPLCPLAGIFEHEIRAAAQGVSGIREADVIFVDTPWTPLASAPWRRWLNETT
jgi:metal-sulfur cluster biosynthetic enzyme